MICKIIIALSTLYAIHFSISEIKEIDFTCGALTFKGTVSGTVK